MEADSYFKLLSESRVVLNCLSPMQLVTTRYFESMAAKALVFCEELPRYDGLFRRDEHYVSFKSDLSDFTEILEFYLTNEAAIRIITEKAYEHVKTFHTWERRIKELTGLISEIV